MQNRTAYTIGKKRVVQLEMRVEARAGRIHLLKLLAGKRHPVARRRKEGRWRRPAATMVRNLQAAVNPPGRGERALCGRHW